MDLADLNRQEDEIAQSIADLRDLLNSKDVSLFFAKKSRNAKFKKKCLLHTVTLPKLIPHIINKEQLYHQFGSLSALSVEINEEGYTTNSPRVLYVRQTTH